MNSKIISVIFLFSFLNLNLFAQKVTLANFPMQDKCEGSINLEFSNEKVRHPINGIPKSIKNISTNVSYEYSDWKRFYDSILTTYKNSKNEKLFIDDFCMWELEVYTCLSINGCSYLLPTSYLD